MLFLCSQLRNHWKISFNFVTQRKLANTEKGSPFVIKYVCPQQLAPSTNFSNQTFSKIPDTETEMINSRTVECYDKTVCFSFVIHVEISDISDLKT